MYEAPIAMTPYQYFDNVIFNFFFDHLLSNCSLSSSSLVAQ